MLTTLNFSHSTRTLFDDSSKLSSRFNVFLFVDFRNEKHSTNRRIRVRRARQPAAAVNSHRLVEKKNNGFRRFVFLGKINSTGEIDFHSRKRCSLCRFRKDEIDFLSLVGGAASQKKRSDASQDLMRSNQQRTKREACIRFQLSFIVTFQ